MKKRIVCVSMIVLSATVPSVTEAAAEQQGQDTASLFGGQGGYIHPYVATTGLYDDNVYRQNETEQSDYAWILSPGIWLAVPGTREQMITQEVSTLTPGGLGLVEDRGESFQRMEGYLHYGAELTRYQEVDDSDTDDQRLDGLFRFRFRGGLRCELMDIFIDGHDDRSEGVSGALDTYTSNLAHSSLTYDLSSRFRLRGRYAHYFVDYDEAENERRDRQDDKFNSYLYYKLSGKSTIFGEYDFVDITYDTTGELDSQEHYLWGGFRWRMTGKSMGEVKLGYLFKDYASEEGDDSSDWVLKGWVDYDLSAKTRLRFQGLRMTEEPDNYAGSAALTNSLSMELAYDLSRKLAMTTSLNYERTEYESDYTYAGESAERTDNKYVVNVGLDYQVQDWLGLGTKYSYKERDSTFADLCYVDNSILISLTVSM